MTNHCSVIAWILGVTFLFVGTSTGPDGLRVGEKVPEFELTSVSGKTVAIREFMNKGIVIVHFWKSK